MMTVLTLTAWFWSFVASAVLPWVSAELLMVALLPTAAAHGNLAALAVAAVAGQMAGKTAIYWIARGGTTKVASGRLAIEMERWRPRLTSPSRAVPLVFASAAIGFPPLFALTILAGSLQMRFRLFFLASTVGRIIHFGAIALIPALLG
jgi:membrane protein YqaA with SNARE-associated domain